jgi:hypothetical protein
MTLTPAVALTSDKPPVADGAIPCHHSPFDDPNAPENSVVSGKDKNQNRRDAWTGGVPSAKKD